MVPEVGIVGEGADDLVSSAVVPERSVVCAAAALVVVLEFIKIQKERELYCKMEISGFGPNSIRTARKKILWHSKKRKKIFLLN